MSRHSFAYERIELPVSGTRTADQELLVAEVRALEERVIQRRLWGAPAVRELLQGAIRAGLQAADVDKGRLALKQAQRVFEDDVQTKNRMFYVLGMFLGAVACAALTIGIVSFGSHLSNNLADRSTIVSLFTFAGVGSLTSVLSRLSQIDLKDELRRWWVLLSGGVRPLVAIAFASIVYVVLKEKMIKLSIGESSPEGLFWVAAFLCGFSERFASDILDRLPFLPRRQQ